MSLRRASKMGSAHGNVTVLASFMTRAEFGRREPKLGELLDVQSTRAKPLTQHQLHPTVSRFITPYTAVMVVKYNVFGRQIGSHYVRTPLRHLA